MRHLLLKEQVTHLNQVLRGHYAYYGIAGNFRALQKVHRFVERYWHKMLCSRSRKGYVRWEVFHRIKTRFPLQRPKLFLCIKEFNHHNREVKTEVSPPQLIKVDDGDIVASHYEIAGMQICMDEAIGVAIFINMAEMVENMVNSLIEERDLFPAYLEVMFVYPFSVRRNQDFVKIVTVTEIIILGWK